MTSTTTNATTTGSAGADRIVFVSWAQRLRLPGLGIEFSDHLFIATPDQAARLHSTPNHGRDFVEHDTAQARKWGRNRRTVGDALDRLAESAARLRNTPPSSGKATSVIESKPTKGAAVEPADGERLPPFKFPLETRLASIGADAPADLADDLKPHVAVLEESAALLENAKDGAGQPILTLGVLKGVIERDPSGWFKGVSGVGKHRAGIIAAAVAALS